MQAGRGGKNQRIKGVGGAVGVSVSQEKAEKQPHPEGHVSINAHQFIQTRSRKQLSSQLTEDL